MECFKIITQTSIKETLQIYDNNKLYNNHKSTKHKNKMQSEEREVTKKEEN